MKKESIYTKKNLETIVAKCKCLREMADQLGIPARGGNLTYLGRQLRKHNINYDHFPGKKGIPWNKGKIYPLKECDLKNWLVNGRAVCSHTLKLRLIKAEIFEHKCNNCDLSIWLNKPIPLELDHIDGDHLNNELKNLQLLCPNCHAMTDNYRGKKLKSKTPKKINRKFLEKSFSIEQIKEKLKTKSQKELAKEIGCEEYVLNRYLIKYKLKERRNQKKANYPPLGDLLEKIEKTNMNQVAKELGISFNALKKYVNRKLAK